MSRARSADEQHREMSKLDHPYRKLKDQGMALLAINFRETAPAARTLTEDVGASFPVLLDIDGKIAAQSQVWSLPATFVLNAKGVLRYKIIGVTNMTALVALCPRVNTPS